MRKLLGLFFLLAGSLSAQTTTFNGILKGTDFSVVQTGQVSFILQPGAIDTTISGNARFVPTTTFCEVHQPTVVSTSGTGTITVVVGTAQTWQAGDSILFVNSLDSTLNANTIAAPYVITLVNSTTSFNFTQAGTHSNGAGGNVGGFYANGGTGGCKVTQNTAITPANTSYKVGLAPNFSQTSAFNTYAIGSGPVDISTVVPTPAQQPAYSFVDTFSNQTIGGNKTFTGVVNIPGGVLVNGVTHNTGPLAPHAPVVGNGTGDLYTIPVDNTVGHVLCMTAGDPAGCAIATSMLPAIPLGSGISGTLPIANNCPGATGASNTTYLRGDCTWNTPAGAGNVSTVGTPVIHQVAVWQSATTASGIGPCSGTTVLHGNASADPSCGQVSLTTDVVGQLPIANTCPGSTGASSTTVLFGDCTWRTPAGGGTTVTICHGTQALGGVGTIGSAGHATINITCTGLLFDDSADISFQGSPIAVVGFVPSTSGVLTVIKSITANTITLDIENNTNSSITVGTQAVTYRGFR